MTNALVVGGNGFLGSHLVDKLVTQGRHVTVFDRFSHGLCNYEAQSVRQVHGDFLNKRDLQEAVVGQDEVFHFLSVTTPATAQDDPTIDIRVNIAQSVELFDACARAQVGRVYFASSGGAIYGEHDRATINENCRLSPKSPYAIAKLALENYLEYFRVSRDLDYRVFRISNPYGARQNPVKPQGLIPIALRQIARGLPVVQFGDGSMVRDYIYTSDLVDMITASIDIPSNFRHYNVGSGQGHSITQVFDVIRSVTGIDFPIVNRPTPSTFVNRVVLDNERFRHDFDIWPKVSLSEGILQTWKSILDSDF